MDQPITDYQVQQVLKANPSIVRKLRRRTQDDLWAKCKEFVPGELPPYPVNRMKDFLIALLIRKGRWD